MPTWGHPHDAATTLATPQSVEHEARALGDEDLAVAGEAADALGRMGAAAFPALRQALVSGSPQQRWGATVALYRSTADLAPFFRR